MKDQNHGYKSKHLPYFIENEKVTGASTKNELKNMGSRNVRIYETGVEYELGSECGVFFYNRKHRHRMLRRFVPIRFPLEISILNAPTVHDDLYPIFFLSKQPNHPSSFIAFYIHTTINSTIDLLSHSINQQK